MHASKGRKYYACTEKRSQKRREIMVTITRRDLCRLALLSLMVAFDGRSYKPTRDSMGDTPMAEESEALGTVGCAGSGAKHVECQCEHVSFLIGKYTKMGMEAIVYHLDRLDNAKNGLEEDVAGILDDQSAAERVMAELRAEQDRYREKLELALQKQQRVVDSLLHLVEDMSGRLKRLEELQPPASGPELPAKPAAAELVERVKTLRSAMEKPMGGPAEAPYAPPRVDPGALPFVPMFSKSTMLGEHTAPAGSMREGHVVTDPRSLTVQMSHAAQEYRPLRLPMQFMRKRRSRARPCRGEPWEARTDMVEAIQAETYG